MSTNFRLYENSELAAHNNVFISDLFMARKALVELQVRSPAGEYVLNGAERRGKLRLCQTMTLDAIERAIAAIRILDQSGTAADKEKSMEIKLWLRHSTWSVGMLATIHSQARSLTGQHDSVDNFELQSVFDRVYAMDVVTTTDICSAAARSAFDRRWQDFQRTRSRVLTPARMQALPTRPTIQAAFANLAEHFRFVVQDIHRYGNLQRLFLSWTRDRAMAAKVDSFVNDAQAITDVMLDQGLPRDWTPEERSNVVKMWRSVHPLHPRSEYMLTLVERVENSVKMCEAYSRRTAIQQTLAYWDHLLAELNSNSARMRDALREGMASAHAALQPHGLIKAGATALGSLLWPAIAPILGLTDAVRSARGTESQLLGTYNAFLLDNWKTRPAATLACVFVAIGVIILPAWPGALTSFPALATHLTVTAAATATVGRIAILAVCDQQRLKNHTEQELREISLVEEAKRARLLRGRAAVRERYERENPLIEHERFARINTQMAEAYERIVLEERRREGDHSTDLPPPARSTAPVQPRPTASPPMPTSPAREQLRDMFNQLTHSDVLGMISESAQERDRFAAELAVLDEQQHRAVVLERRHARNTGCVYWSGDLVVVPT